MGTAATGPTGQLTVLHGLIHSPVLNTDNRALPASTGHPCNFGLQDESVTVLASVLGLWHCVPAPAPVCAIGPTSRPLAS